MYFTNIFKLCRSLLQLVFVLKANAFKRKIEKQP